MTEGPPAGPRVVLGRETSPTPSREVRAVIVLLILTVSCLSHIFAHCHISNVYLFPTNNNFYPLPYPVSRVY